jgi:hypothetical protein
VSDLPEAQTLKKLNLKECFAEFHTLKRENFARNQEYYLLRQAVQGNFRWPRDWPNHIPKVKHNLCKPITERFATYLMGKGFTWNLQRPNSPEHRESAERAEKALTRILQLSDSELQFEMGAKLGSQLGRTVYKVYKAGEVDHQRAAFSYCQPDYFYGVPSGDNTNGDFSVVYYAYPLDRLEAKRRYGDHPYKSELEVDEDQKYDTPPERWTADRRTEQSRNVPVLEIWTKEMYALVVGGQVIFNGENPNKWESTKEGFIPFVVIENVANAGTTTGEADIGQARELNETLNYTISRKLHIVSRWLQPTLVWEGAPQNYAEVLATTIGGGGAIPVRLGGRLYFLAYDRPNPAVQEIEATLRMAILETAGMNEIAMQGTVQGSINTGPALQAQFQPVLSTVGKKQTAWTAGLKRLFAMLLERQEQIGDSKALGEAVINSTVKSEAMEDGELVALSGKDIKGLREVSIEWPGVLPADSSEMAQLEMQKATQGLQSFYTTLEKLGEKYPDDELARVRQENTDPSIKGQVVAEQTRSNATMLSAQAGAAKTMGEAMAAPDVAAMEAEGEEPPIAPEGDIGPRLREMARASAPSMDLEEEAILSGAPGGY